MVEVFNISQDYVRILWFLYPEYAILPEGTKRIPKFSKFIAYRDIKTSAERDALNYEYEDCVFISRRIFDKLLDESALRDMVLSFVHTRLRGRKRVCRTLNSEGSAFIDELIHFMFTGSSFADTEGAVSDLFSTYGSGLFDSVYLQSCQDRSLGVTTAVMETYVSKILSNVDLLFYKKAKARLGNKLQRNLKSAITQYRDLDPYYRSQFGDLSSLKLFTDLVRG